MRTGTHHWLYRRIWAWAAVLTVIGPGAMGLAYAGNGLEFSKDTVRENMYDPSDTVYLMNTSTDSLVVDTVIVILDTSEMPMCEVRFAIPGMLGYGLWNSGMSTVDTIGLEPIYSGNDPIGIGAGREVLMHSFRYDLCISCPLTVWNLAKRSWLVGDSIWVSLVFVAGRASDTLVVKGTREVWSLGASRQGSLSAGQRSTGPEPSTRSPYLVNGRRWTVHRPGGGLLAPHPMRDQ